VGCSVCGGVWHPSTGSYVSPTFRRCGPCERAFVKWLAGHLRRKWGRVDFYVAAATSIRPEEDQMQEYGPMTLGEAYTAVVQQRDEVMRQRDALYQRLQEVKEAAEAVNRRYQELRAQLKAEPPNIDPEPCECHGETYCEDDK
jgi:hypothetical protein